MSINRQVDKKIAILGLGREGQSTLKFLKRKGIKADVLDLKFDGNYLNKLSKYDLIFRTPGLPRLHPKLLAAEKKGVKISSHTKLFFELCPGKIIGVTGTKGKTTTTSLIYKILKIKYKKSVFLGGNIGRPALDILPKLNKNSLVILELSSFQLQDLDKSPAVAVITNITLDHLDPNKKFGPSTHQNAKEYFNAKLNITRHQGSTDFAIVHSSLKSRIKNIGKGKKAYPNPLSPAGRLKIKLKGQHNFENIALAIAVGKIFKVPKKNILKIIKNFKGIEHRLEFVRKIIGVSFYNDSAATNPDATLAALKSFKEQIYLILGGSDKGLDYKELAKYIVKTKNVKSVILIGQLKQKLYKLLKKYNNKQSLIIKKVNTLKEAVLTCFKKAAKNEVVLLSPAAASFDMFQDYSQRGDKFKKIVNKLRR